MDVRPRLARQTDGQRRLARAHRADAAPLYAGGRADRVVVSSVVRRTRRRADAARACVPLDRRSDLRRGLHGDGADAAVSRPGHPRSRCTASSATGWTAMTSPPASQLAELAPYFLRDLRIASLGPGRSARGVTV